MALGKPSAAFAPNVEAWEAVPKPAEKIDVKASAEQVKGKTKEAMGGLLTEVLDGQKAKEIADTLKNGEKLSVEQHESIHAAREGDLAAGIDYGTTKNVIKVAKAEMVKQFGPGAMTQLDSIAAQFS